MKVIYQTIIKREDLRANPDVAYLFGDNLMRSGYGGQAKEMRGEPNAIGVPTKKKPTMHNDAFMTDDEYDLNVAEIRCALSNLYGYDVVVIPAKGIGTGLACLDVCAPKTFAYLQESLDDLGYN